MKKEEIKLGVEKGKVVLDEYNDEWERIYKEEEKKLNKLIGKYVIKIEHVGSTAIPGLIAKPIIDMGIAVEDLNKNLDYIEILKNNGYEYRDDNGIKGERLFKKINNGLTTHFIHIVEIKSKRWHDFITFRDYLLSHPEEIKTYADLKKSLEKKYANDRKQYTASKNKYISEIIEQADEINNNSSTSNNQTTNE